MEVFCTFKAVKKILKAVTFLAILANVQQVMGTNYTWNNSVTNGNWTDPANWTPNGIPGATDTVYFTGESAVSVTLQSVTLQQKETYISNIFFNTSGDSLITIDLNGKKLICSNVLMLVAEKNTNHDSNVTIKGSGTLNTRSFDFPSSKIHTFTIQDEATVLEITETLWGDSTGLLKFTGNGYLYMPRGGAKVDTAPANISYTGLKESNRRAYQGVYTYSCTITEPDFSTNPPTPATIVFSGGNGNVRIPFTVTITGGETYTLNSTELESKEYTGNKYKAYNLDGTVSDSHIEEGSSNIALSTSTYTLSVDQQINTKGHGIQIKFYSPDGYDPDESFMEIGRITWFYQTPVWTGNGDTAYWTDEGNWTGTVGISDLTKMSDYDIEISVSSPKNTPVINSDVSVKSLTILAGSNVTLKDGKFTTNKIETLETGSKFISDGGTVELIKSGTTEPELKYAYNDPSTISIKQLSIAENASFSMPLSMNLDMLILNSGAGFSKGGNALDVGWLMLSTEHGAITLSEELKAESIFLLLRNGDIYLEKSLTAEKDIIIGGPDYSSSKFKYEQFTSRPAGWVQRYPPQNIAPSSTSTLNPSSVNLSSGVSLIVENSADGGNFYINGANLNGTSGNQIIIPANDNPANFCAEAVNSTITNITVSCSTSGGEAKIPAEDCSLTNCTNFDSDDFEITKANTVADNRIYLEFDYASNPPATEYVPRTVRNIYGELNSTTAAAIITSDSKAFSGFSADTTSTTAPAEENPASFYIYTDNTTWNLDATGSSEGGIYGNYEEEERHVTPYLVIPQYTDSCGYTITDKWGKRIKAYSPAFTAVEDGVDKTITWTGKVDTKWEERKNWVCLKKAKTIAENLAEYEETLILKDTINKPVINSGDWSLKSLKIESPAVLTINGGTYTAEKIVVESIPSKENGKFIQNGGDIIIKGNAAEISAPAADSLSFVKIELLSSTNLTLASDFSTVDLILNDGVIINSSSYKLKTTNLQITADTGTLSLASDYSARNIYFLSGRTDIAASISAENILAYGGTINLTTQNSLLEAEKDFIILGSNYKTDQANDYDNSKFNYSHFALRPDGWTSVNIPISDIGKLPDGSILQTFSANLTAAAGAAISAGSSVLSGSGNGNLYINGTSLTGSGEWFISIPQNDTPANFCTEAIDSSISNCTVKCAADNSADGTKSQLPAEDCTLTGCKNFDSEDFNITKAYTVTDKRIYVEFDNKKRPLRNTNAELSNFSSIKSINIGNSMQIFGYVTAIYNSKSGETAPSQNPTQVYFVSNTTWNTDASSDSIGSGNYTDSSRPSGHFKRVKPSLYIPQYVLEIDDNYNVTLTCGYLLTDKWGKRLTDYTFDDDTGSDRAFNSITDGIPDSEKTPRVPPSFSAVLSAIGSNKISLTFSKPIVIDSSKIAYYYQDEITKEVTKETITQSMPQLLPRCFDIISINSAGEAILSDLQIDKNVNAQIENFSTGYSIVTLQLTRTVTLKDIKNLYIRLNSPKDDSGNPLYPPTKYDNITEMDGVTVSFIQESDAAHTEEGINCMIIKTAHTLSDFANGAVKPSYAYISNLKTSGDSDFYKNIYGSEATAVHDFSKTQKNYGTISYGQDITIVSKVITGSDSSSESDYPPVVKLYVSDNPDSASLFPIIKNNFNKSLSAWLPSLSEISLNEFKAYTDSLNSRFWEIKSKQIKENSPSNGYTFTIEKDNVLKMISGSQLSFLHKLCDSDGNYIRHYLSPYCDYETGLYDLSKTSDSPLFAFSLSNPADLLSLTPWYMTLKSINEQRGGVTILNNVINSLNGEKTVVKVNMPSSGNLDVIVMTLDGNIVKYLNRGSASAGEHFYYWDGRNNAGSPCARGLYFIIIKAAGIDETRKVMVVK